MQFDCFCWCHICIQIALNGVEEGKALVGEEGRDEKVACSKKTELKIRMQKSIPYL